MQQAERYITKQLLDLLKKDSFLPDDNSVLWDKLLSHTGMFDTPGAHGIPKLYSSITNQARKNIRAALKTALLRWK
jgi:hypothetical protein